MRVLLIDNYDSFTYNLRQLLIEEGVDLSIRMNDELEELVIGHFDKILISPGPGVAAESGYLLKFLDKHLGKVPMLGICLGHQALLQADGAILKPLGKIIHGEAYQMYIKHDDPILEGMSDGFIAGRYHSWIIESESISPATKILCTDEEGHLMAFSNPVLKTWGFQFHPESYLSPEGPKLLRNWLQYC